ncbi:MAG: hypothetical protein R3C46_11205 [Hyphomonadaceae bacterium]
MRWTRIAFLGAAVAFAPSALAQSIDITWQKVFPIEGDRGQINAMIVTESGNIVVGGALTRPVEFAQGEAYDAWVAMYAPNGEQLWSQQFGGEFRDDVVDLVEDRDGGIIVTGSRDTVRRQSRISENVFAAKFSATGELIWDKILNDGERRTLSEVTLADDGGILLSGQTTPSGEAGSRPIVIKLTPSGEFRWVASPPTPPVDQSPQNAIVASTGKGGPYTFDVARISAAMSDGIEVTILRNTWAAQGMQVSCVTLNSADGSPTTTPCSAAALNGFKQDELFVGGRTANFDVSDPMVTRRDTNGGVAWQRAFVSVEGDGLFGVAATPDGGVVGAGFQLIGNRVQRHNWDGFLVRLDANGKELWRRTFGGKKREEFKAVKVLADGSIVVAGFTGSQTGVQDWAPWIMRLNSQGELEGAALKELQDRQF